MAHKTKSSDTSVNSDEWLTFELEKTHQTLFEAGKSLGKALLTYLSFICLTALLVYGKSAEDSVSVPLLGLKVNKDLAAAITVLLCQVVQIWVISLLVQTTTLTNLFSSQLRQRYKRVSYESWYMQYPSPFHSVQFLLNTIPGKQGPLLSLIVYLGYSAIVAFVPYQLSRVIARAPSFPAHLQYRWNLLNTLLNALVSFAMLATAIYLRKSNQDLIRPGNESPRDLSETSAQMEERRQELAAKQSKMASQIARLENALAEGEEQRSKLLAQSEQALAEGEKLLNQTRALAEGTRENSQS